MTVLRAWEYRIRLDARVSRGRSFFAGQLLTAALVSNLVFSACVASSEHGREDAVLARGERIDFEAADGVRLTGTVFGLGRSASSSRTWAGEAIRRRTSIGLLGRWPSAAISR
jgi:hypothetical protein